MNSLKISSIDRSAIITKMILVDSELFLNSSSKWYIKYHNVAAKINQLIDAIEDHITKGGSGSFDCIEGELTVSISGYEPIKLNMFEIDELVMSEIDCVLAGIYTLDLKPVTNKEVEEVDVSFSDRDCFSYFDFVKSELDLAEEAFSPSTMIRKALSAGSPDKGDLLVTRLRNTCESLANTKGYYRSKSQTGKGYLYGKSHSKAQLSIAL